MNIFDSIDWNSMFVPTASVLEMIIRGTVMYIGMFVLLRIFRRQTGSLSIADLLLIVIIADAAQNGMAGEAKTVTEALVLICTIIFWDYAIDWLGFKSQVMSKVLEPEPVLLIENGTMLTRNMEREKITEDELKGQLRLQGVDDISKVSKCFMESNGEFSVIKKDGSSTRIRLRKDGGSK